MSFFDDSENVKKYIKMATGYDGRELIAVLERYVQEGASVLELGMGPGVDLDLLTQNFRVTGSDFSRVFLDMYQAAHLRADLLMLDAVTIETERRFDVIYSNKVLMHLSKAELRASFARQREVVNPGGFVLHSFWYGDSETEYDGLRFIYYTETELLRHAGPGFEVVEMARYTEMEPDDSFYVLLRIGE